MDRVSINIIKLSGLFCSDWYLSNYPEVLGVDPVEHYFYFGANEGKRPSPNFDGNIYWEENPDVRLQNFNPLLHWILHGRHEGRRFPEVSNTAQRADLVATVAAQELNNCESVEELKRERILKSGLFDESWYRAAYPEIGNYDPALHYVRHGAAEGRAVSNHFDVEAYLDANPDIRAANINPLLHWLEHGLHEGREFPSLKSESNGDLNVKMYCNPDFVEDFGKKYDDNFKISIITPTYNTDPIYIRELYNSIANQTYGNWQWVICDDCSGNPETVSEIRRIASSDSRVVVRFLKNAHGISEATNAALAMSDGDYIALVDHDDLLTRDIFEAIWEAWKKNDKKCDLFYTDECKLGLDGRLYDFFHKPGWSPTLLESTMYVGHLSVYRRDVVISVGGMRSEYDGTQDYDLALRLIGKLHNVLHVPRIGYLWRAIPGSTATSLSEKSYAIEKQRSAVTVFANELSENSHVTPGPSLGYWRIKYPLVGRVPRLSVVIPTGAGKRLVRGQDRDLLVNCIASLVKTNFYPDMEFVIVHNGDLSWDHYHFLDKVENVKLVQYDEKILNLSRKINIGVVAATGEYVCLMNDDVEAISQHSGLELIEFMETHPKVGAIGPMCLYEDGRVQHNGIVMLEQGPSHSGILKEPSFSGPFNYLRLRREAFGVTGALLVTRKSDYLKVGGFNEDLPLNYNDVEFCAKLRSIGLSSVVDPDVKVYHFESATKIGTFKYEKEILYRNLPDIADKYFNPNFIQSSPYYEMRQLSGQVGIRGADDYYEFEQALDCNIRRRAYPLSSRSMKFTLAVSVFNQPKSLLAEMLGSILAQTYDNLEIIIYDHASSFGETLDWLETVKENLRIKFLRSEKNLGISRGQKFLLENATGDYFLPIDADDFITIDCVEIMARAAIENPDVEVFYSDEFKSDMSSSKFSPFYKTSFDHLKILNCCYVSHQMMFKTSFLREVSAYSDDRATWCHDWDSTLRALQFGARFMHVPELLYAWRINPGSTASAETAGKPEALDSQKFVLQRYLDFKGLEDILYPEINMLGPNTGMWSINAHRAVKNISIVNANELWQLPESDCAKRLRIAAGKGNYTLLMLEGTDLRLAKLELSVPIHLDPNIKVVGSTILDSAQNIAWAGGIIDHQRAFEPAYGLNPRQGGYHGQLYCQRLVDLVAAGNVLIDSNLLVAALDQLGNALDPDRLMVTLSIICRENLWLTATTPRLEAYLPLHMRGLIPLDRDFLLGQSNHDHPSRWKNGLLGARHKAND